jgi:hypothetical protein
VPANFVAMAKSGANPISPEEVTEKIMRLASASSAPRTPTT